MLCYNSSSTCQSYIWLSTFIKFASKCCLTPKYFVFQLIFRSSKQCFLRIVIILRDCQTTTFFAGFNFHQTSRVFEFQLFDSWCGIFFVKKLFNRVKIFARPKIKDFYCWNGIRIGAFPSVKKPLLIKNSFWSKLSRPLKVTVDFYEVKLPTASSQPQQAWQPIDLKISMARPS